jgi:SynChlorMet cassette radical SAM/SPASM protein ScmF
VDGARAESHESLRAVPGSFEKAIEGIRALVEAGFRPQLICTLHKGNVGEIEEVIALAERLGCGSVKFNHIQRIGRGEKMLEEEKGLGIEELIALNDDMEKSIAGRAKIRTFFDVPYAFMSIRRIQVNIGARCNVLSILGILPEGELSLCGIGTTFPELIYGHISLENLRTVWLSSPGLQELREKIPLRIEGICKECLFREYCMGQCIANNFRNGRKINAPFFFCQRAYEIGKFPRSRVKWNQS